MAINKKASFGRRKQELAKFSKALSHPARIAILRKLAQNSTCICGEIVESLPLSQSTVSQHIKELKDAGLIEGGIAGPKSLYSLNWKALESFESEFARLMNNLRNKK